jgi:hypothetical protein
MGSEQRPRKREIRKNALHNKALEMAKSLTTEQRLEYLERELRDSRQRHQALLRRVEEHAVYVKEIKHAVKAARRHINKKAEAATAAENKGEPS